MSERDFAGYPRVDASITAGWPGGSASTSSPKSGVLFVKEPAFAMGGGAESRLTARNTRPVIGPACTAAENEMSKRSGAACGTGDWRVGRIGARDVAPTMMRAMVRPRGRMGYMSIRAKYVYSSAEVCARSERF